MSFDPESDDASIRFSLMELGGPPRRQEHGQAPLARVISTETVTKADHVVGLTRPRNRQIVDLDTDPFVPDGWSVEEHRKGGMFDFDASKVVLYFTKVQERKGWLEWGKTTGHKLREELEAQPVFNANLLDWLMRKENQHHIPKEWKRTAAIFWGTIYRWPEDSLCVRILSWEGDEWCWCAYWLNTRLPSCHPAAVSAS